MTTRRRNLWSNVIVTTKLRTKHLFFSLWFQFIFKNSLLWNNKLLNYSPYKLYSWFKHFQDLFMIKKTQSRFFLYNKMLHRRDEQCTVLCSKSVVQASVWSIYTADTQVVDRGSVPLLWLYLHVVHLISGRFRRQFDCRIWITEKIWN